MIKKLLSVVAAGVFALSAAIIVDPTEPYPGYPGDPTCGIASSCW
ncbi:hypothetical protein ACIA49_19830 [Kribbella sp. NPDC051587]